MNYRIIGRTAGTILLTEAVCLVIPLIAALIYGEGVLPFIISAAVMCAVGVPLNRLKLGKTRFYARDGFAAAALGWMIMSLFGALPFALCGRFGSFADCVFESASGFTTTGSSILTDIESLPKSILLWRSFTHFIGGMGVVVLTTAIVPADGERAQFLMRAEVPGPTADKLVPRLADSSKILYAIYAALTVIQIILLLICGLSFYDSLNVAFATAGTGGFSVMNASIGGYGNPAAEIVTSVFMLLFALNFVIYFLVLTKKAKQALKSEELRFFLAVVLAAIIIVAVNTAGYYSSLGENLRITFFTVASIISSTGFSVTDHNLWPELSKSVVIIIMMIGACAGSTGGGIKASRVLLGLRTLKRAILQMIHPNSVTIVRLDGRAVEEKTLIGIMQFIVAYFLTLFIVMLLLSFDRLGFVERLGPGLGAIGPSGNFAALSVFSKLLLALTMIIGRLEIWPILIFFSSFVSKK